MKVGLSRQFNLFLQQVALILVWSLLSQSLSFASTKAGGVAKVSSKVEVHTVAPSSAFVKGKSLNGSESQPVYSFDKNQGKEKRRLDTFIGSLNLRNLTQAIVKLGSRVKSALKGSVFKSLAVFFSALRKGAMVVSFVVVFLGLGWIFVLQAAFADSPDNDMQSTQVTTPVESLIIDLSFYRTRRDAVEKLIEIGAPAVKPLIQALGDAKSEVREAAARALEGIGAPAYNVVIKGLSSDDSYIRSGSAEVLGKMGNIQARGPLLEALKDKRHMVRESALSALRRLDWEPANDIQTAYVYLAEQNWEDLVLLGEPAVEPLIGVLGDWQEIRNAVVNVLVRIGLPSVKPLIEVLNDSDSSVREAAASALRQLVADQAVEELNTALLEHADQDVRVRVAEILGEIKSKHSVEPLTLALGDESAAVRKAAAESLVKLNGKRVVSSMIQALNHENEFLRSWAIWVLGEIGDRRAVGPLCGVLDDNPAVAEALGKIGDEKAVEPLIQIVESADAAEEMKQAAVKALGMIGDERAQEPLIEIFEHKENGFLLLTETAGALDILGWSPALAEERAYFYLAKADWEKLVELGAAAVDLLVEVLNLPGEEHIQKRAAAAWALGEIGNQEAVEALSKFIEEIFSRITTSAETLEEIKTLEAVSVEGFLGNLLNVLNNEGIDGVKRTTLWRIWITGEEREAEPLIELLEDSYLGAAVASAFGKIRGEEALAVLSSVLEKDGIVNSVKKSAIWGLGEIGDERVVEDIAEFIDDAYLRLTTVEALGKIGGEKSLDILMQVLAGRNPAQLKQMAAWGLGEIRDVRATDLLMLALGDESPEVRETSAESLLKIGLAVKEPLIDQALTADNYYTRRLACWILGELRDESVLEVLVNTYRTDEAMTVKEEAVRALGKLGDEAALETLWEALGDENPFLREAAVWSLGRIGGVSARQNLINILNEQENEPFFRVAAAKALGKIGGEGVFEILKNVLEDGNSFVQAGAVTALGIMDDERVAGLLMETLQTNSYWWVRAAAVTALGEIGTEETMEALVLVLREEGKVAEVAAETLFDLKGKAVNVLLKHLRDEDSRLTAKVMELLQEIADIRAVKPLMLIENSWFESKTRKQQARETLAAIKAKVNLEEWSRVTYPSFRERLAYDRSEIIRISLYLLLGIGGVVLVSLRKKLKAWLLGWHSARNEARRMGKNVEVGSVKGNQAAVYDTNGNKHILILNPGGRFNLAGLEMKTSPEEVSSALFFKIESFWHRRHQEKRPVKIAVYDELVDDLFGFIKTHKNLIALHKSVADNPLALFHEVSEYLLEEKEIDLRLAGLRSDVLYISVKEGEAKKRTLKLKLSEATLKFIKNEEWKENWKTDPHYLLRILQRELFKEKDKELSLLIREQQLLHLMRHFWHRVRYFLKKDDFKSADDADFLLEFRDHGQGLLEAGELTLSLNGYNGNRLTILVKTGKKQRRQVLRLSRETAAFIKSRNWPQGWEKDSTYLLTVWEKERFGDKYEDMVGNLDDLKKLQAAGTWQKARYFISKYGPRAVLKAMRNSLFISMPFTLISCSGGRAVVRTFLIVWGVCVAAFTWSFIAASWPNWRIKFAFKRKFRKQGLERSLLGSEVLDTIKTIYNTEFYDRNAPWIVGENTYEVAFKLARRFKQVNLSPTEVVEAIYKQYRDRLDRYKKPKVKRRARAQAQTDIEAVIEMGRNYREKFREKGLNQALLRNNILRAIASLYALKAGGGYVNRQRAVYKKALSLASLTKNKEIDLIPLLKKVFDKYQREAAAHWNRAEKEKSRREAQAEIDKAIAQAHSRAGILKEESRQLLQARFKEALAKKEKAVLTSIIDEAQRIDTDLALQLKVLCGLPVPEMKPAKKLEIKRIYYLEAAA